MLVSSNLQQQKVDRNENVLFQEGALGDATRTYNSVGMVPVKPFSPKSRIVRLRSVLL
jgi:hypothetical protein